MCATLKNIPSTNGPGLDPMMEGARLLQLSQGLVWSENKIPKVTSHTGHLISWDSTVS
jgi:hypothetical protein